MEVTLNCEVCATNLSVEGVEMPWLELIMNIWASSHKHSEMELRMYHDSDIAVRQYQHSHPFGGEDAEEVDPNDLLP